MLLCQPLSPRVLARRSTLTTEWHGLRGRHRHRHFAKGGARGHVPKQGARGIRGGVLVFNFARLGVSGRIHLGHSATERPGRLRGGLGTRLRHHRALLGSLHTLLKQSTCLKLGEQDWIRAQVPEPCSLDAALCGIGLVAPCRAVRSQRTLLRNQRAVLLLQTLMRQHQCGELGREGRVLGNLRLMLAAQLVVQDGQLLVRGAQRRILAAQARVARAQRGQLLRCGRHELLRARLCLTDARQLACRRRQLRIELGLRLRRRILRLGQLTNVLARHLGLDLAQLGQLRHQLLLRMPDTHLQLRLVRRLGA